MDEQLVPVGKVQGGGGVGDYFWEHDGDVIDVPSSLASQLLRQPGGGFFDPSQPGAVYQGHGRVGGIRTGFSADPEQPVKGSKEATPPATPPAPAVPPPAPAAPAPKPAPAAKPAPAKK